MSTSNKDPKDSYKIQHDESDSIDPRNLSLLGKIVWIFFSPIQDKKEQREEERRRNEAQKPKEPELTEEEKARLEEQRLKKKRIIIFSILTAILLIITGSSYWYYSATHVTSKDINKCVNNFRIGKYQKAFKYCYKARNEENANILYALGYMYESGKGVPPEEFDTKQNHQLAKIYFEKAAGLNFLKAQIKLGNEYITGSILVEPNNDNAIKWLRLAAQQDSEESMQKLVELLLKEKKIPEAVEWLKELASRGDPDAAYTLAQIYSDGIDAKPDYDLAFKYCKQSSDKGHPDAEHLMALMYKSGLGTQLDYEEAYIYETRAAAHGQVEATYQAALMTENGIGTEVDIQKAYNYYQAAANRGHTDAQFKLAYFYEYGLGTKKDLIQAITWYTMAANRGSTDAMLALARMNKNGQGTTRNPEEAYNWYKKAAEKPNLEAYFNLGMAHLKGLGTEQNKAKAKEYLTMAATTGYPPAEYELGLILLQEGKYSQAEAWFKKALNKGHAFSAAYLGYMNAKGLGTQVSNYMAYFYFLISNALYPSQTTQDNIQIIKSSLSKDQQNAAEIRAQKFIHQLMQESNPSEPQKVD